MDWFKRSPGITIFVAIWLLILLVPIWQLRARRQWKSDELFLNPNVGLGLTDSLASQAAQQFPDDVVAQEARLSSEHFNGFTDLNKQRRTMDDYFVRYAALSRRFPQSVYVRSCWLRRITRASIQVESEAQIKSYGSQEMQLASPSVSPRTLQAAIRCAREGAKIEPNNAYWPWMEAVVLFSLRRDTAALQALERAGECKAFDDGILNEVRARSALNRRMRLSDWEDDANEQWQILLPHLSRLRAAARAAMWQARLAYDSGDKKRALQIAGVVQRASLPVARNRELLITPLVGEAMCYVAWQETLKLAKIELPPQLSEEDLERRRLSALYFAQYATKLGNPKLGQSAIDIQRTLTIWKLGQALTKPEFNVIMQKAMPVTQLHWLLSWLLTISLCGAIVWLLACVSTFKTPLVSVQVRRSMLVWAAFCVGATGVILYVASQSTVKNILGMGFFYGAAQQTEGLKFDFEAHMPAILWCLWLVAFALSTLVNTIRLKWQARTTLVHQGVDWMALTRFLIYASLFVGVVTTLKTLSESSLDTVLGQIWPAPIFLMIASLLAACAFHIVTNTGKARLAALFISGSALLGFCAVSVTLVDSTQNGSYILGIAPIAFGFILIGAFLLKERGDFKLSNLWQFVVDLSLRLRLMAASAAVCGSVIYLLLTLASIPVRRDVQQETNQQIQMGEVAYIEQKLKSQSGLQ